MSTLRVIAVAWLCLSASAAFAQMPNPADLVRRMREREAWIDKVDSLSLKASHRWVKTPEGQQKALEEVLRLAPGTDPAKHPDAALVKAGLVEQEFDRKRIRLLTTYDDVLDLRFWDGQRVVVQERRGKKGTSASAIVADPASWVHPNLWTHFYCFRGGPHIFWWHNKKTEAEIRRYHGEPEAFVSQGESEFHGVRCHAVSHWKTWTTLYIAVDDGRLRGHRSGSQPTRRSLTEMLQLYRDCGFDLADLDESGQRKKPLTDDEKAVLEKRGAPRMARMVDPVFEFWYDDEKEVAPGCWMPMTQYASHFAVNKDGNHYESQRDELKMLSVRVNERLADALFVPRFLEGEEISDETVKPPKRYRYRSEDSLE